MQDAVKHGRWSKLARSFFSPAEDDPFRASRMVRLAATIAGLFLFVFFAWAIFSRLDSAVSANGVLSVEGKRKKVQHHQGGIVDAVYVRSGDQVRMGQRLLALNQTQSEAALGILLSEQDAILALEARLKAEIDAANSVEFPFHLMRRSGVDSEDASMSGQRKLFEQRQQTHDSTIRVLASRRGQLSEIVAGLRAQLESSVEQAELIKRERSGIQSLYEKGFATLPRLLALQRAEAALKGQHGELRALIAENTLKIGEVDVEILRLKSERLDKIAAEMREAQRKKFELIDRIRAAHDLVERSIIVAPADGTIVALKVFSRGEVVQPGTTVMEVVPHEDQLVVEARIDPNDADNLRPGMPARIRLNPFKTRAMPVVTGRVREVSADRLVDERTGDAFYLVEVEMDRKEVRAVLGRTPLQPGLPAEVMISLGEHSPLEYLVAPLTRRVRHAMREE
jgi:HlyD family type I secretion membrane fusion protein